MTADTVLYVAWQDENTRRWFTVGRLQRLPEGQYEFVYVKGYDDARRIAGMEPILGFKEIDQRYLSERLFPQFQNRIMSPTREDYEEYLRRLGFDSVPKEPLEILARSEGHRVTDSLQMIPSARCVPDELGQATYSLRFFVHGMRHVRPEVQELDFKPGTRLFLMWDFQNAHDRAAITLRTEENHLVGWVPRYYCADIHSLREKRAPIDVTVERMNPSPVPSWLRVLCHVRATWPEGFRAFAGQEFEPIPDGAAR
jgi:hypothetical protein